MNYKNNKPKSFKGHCAMCAEGRRRNQRALTMQERRAKLNEVESVSDPEYSLFCLCDECVGYDVREPDLVAPLTIKLGELLMRAA